MHAVSRPVKLQAAGPCGPATKDGAKGRSADTFAAASWEAVQVDGKQ